ncbi:hypothetical protein [Bosea sp. 685]|uniref:hypothetical protein n=1 Tax=Bosea sp. 685 TaxID=3080057 RepID=UPI002892F3C8|nr:hypothetical protein [Bosea sp. 685]WNJ88492.1 hypothetical protein RMR04_18985 [Bosea sp. 685]
MHPLDFARSLSSPFLASLFGLGLCFVTPGGALAKSSGPAIEARISLIKLVRIAAMQADYGQPVEAHTDRRCQDEMAAAWVAEATKSAGGFPIDSQRLCRLADETYADKDSRIIIVQARSGASCEIFKLSLDKFTLKSQGNVEFKTISTHSINTERSLNLMKRAGRYYRINDHSVDCSDGKYSVRFPRRAFYHFF